MGIKCGIVGLPNVGKSTLFNALTQAQNAAAANYPFCTIDPNIGVVPVPDPRLIRLADIAKSEKVIATTVEFVDIAGLVAGASKGEGLGNKFLAHIREVDAVAHVVRCFENDDVVHVSGRIDPLRDIEVINTELALADLDTVERALARAEKVSKAGDKDAIRLRELLKRIRAHLDQGRPARSLAIDAAERPLLQGDAAHHDEAADVRRERRGERLPRQSASRCGASGSRLQEGAEVVPVCAAIESEIALLDEGDRAAFLDRARARGARPQSRHPRRLPPARAADVLHRRTEGSARVDRRTRVRSRRRPPARSTRTSRRASSAPRSSPTTITSRSRASWARKKPASCGSKARNTSSARAT